jgi:hypothetical protein
MKELVQFLEMLTAQGVTPTEAGLLKSNLETSGAFMAAHSNAMKTVPGADQVPDPKRTLVNIGYGASPRRPKRQMFCGRYFCKPQYGAGTLPRGKDRFI